MATGHRVPAYQRSFDRIQRSCGLSRDEVASMLKGIVKFYGYERGRTGIMPFRRQIADAVANDHVYQGLVLHWWLIERRREPRWS